MGFTAHEELFFLHQISAALAFMHSKVWSMALIVPLTEAVVPAHGCGGAQLSARRQQRAQAWRLWPGLIHANDVSCDV